VGFSFKRFAMGGDINSYFLALIPKDSNPSSFSIFFPISLCNVSYNIFSNLLACHLKLPLPLLISENQREFIPGRQIIDNIILIKEALDSSWHGGIIV